MKGLTRIRASLKRAHFGVRYAYEGIDALLVRVKYLELQLLEDADALDTEQLSIAAQGER